MRVTNNMLVRTMMLNLNNNLGRMDKAQQQLSTGKKIQRPSDDPIIASRALKFRTDVSEIEQFQKNVSDARSWMEVTETALSNLGDILHRAKELTTQAASENYTNDDKQKIKAEISQLKDSIVQIANSTYGGRYVFAGFRTDKPPFDANGPDGKLRYQELDLSSAPTGQKIIYEVGVGNQIQVNVEGHEIFGVDADGEERFFETFRKLEKALNGDVGYNVSDALTALDKDTNQLLKVRADVGARMNFVELTENRLSNDYVDFTELMSRNEDADMAEVIMNLQNEENVYRASLSAGARIIQPTLVDFLK